MTGGVLLASTPLAEGTAACFPFSNSARAAFATAKAALGALIRGAVAASPGADFPWMRREGTASAGRETTVSETFKTSFGREEIFEPEACSETADVSFDREVELDAFEAFAGLAAAWTAAFETLSSLTLAFLRSCSAFSSASNFAICYFVYSM